jgi:hypothetical protein
MTWLRLLGTEPGRISPAMPVPSLRRVAAFVVSVLLAGPVMAETVKPASPAKPAATAKPAPAPAAGPKQIGKFDDWTAATHQESGTTVCYAFTRAQTSSPAVSGRGPVIVTITQRPTLRDAVAIEAGFSFAANAAVTVQVDQTGLEFYTDKRNAFARDGKAVTAAFSKSARAVARSPGPHNAQVTDTFSLKGFVPAYAAINKACPPK